MDIDAQKSLDVRYDALTDEIVLVNQSTEHAYNVSVELQIKGMNERTICTLRRQMTIACCSEAPVWELPAPYEPFVQIHIGGADGSESASPTPSELWREHRMTVSLYLGDGQCVAEHSYVRNPEKKRE